MKKIIMGILLASVFTLPALADTLTTRLRLTKPTIGSTGWPQKTNNNWDLVDSKVAGLNLVNSFTAQNIFKLIDITTMTASSSTITNLTVTGNLNANGSLLTSITPANISAGSLPANVIASSIAVNAVQDGSIVSVSASKLTGTGTLPSATIDGSSVTKQGNSFNTGSQLLQLSAGLVPNANVDGSSITKMGNAFNGNNQLLQLGATALVPNANVDNSSVTKQGNTFNSANKLVQLDSSGKLPAIDGSQLTGIPAAVLSGTQTFTGGNTMMGKTTFYGLVTFSTGSIKPPTITTYLTGSGTYTTPAGVIWLRIRLSGAGGGGGGGGSASSGFGAGGGSGAGGGYVEHIATAPLASYSYAVGAKGTGGVTHSTGDTGTTGGTTTFGTTFLSATGGTGGTGGSTVTTPGAAGTPGTGTGGNCINAPGQNGLNGNMGLAGAAQGLNSSPGGYNPTGLGVGGNGGGGAQNGIDGTAGSIIIEEHYN